MKQPVLIVSLLLSWLEFGTIFGFSRTGKSFRTTLKPCPLPHAPSSGLQRVNKVQKVIMRRLKVPKVLDDLSQSRTEEQVNGTEEQENGTGAISGRHAKAMNHTVLLESDRSREGDGSTRFTGIKYNNWEKGTGPTKNSRGYHDMAGLGAPPNHQYEYHSGTTDGPLAMARHKRLGLDRPNS